MNRDSLPSPVNEERVIPMLDIKNLTVKRGSDLILAGVSCEALPGDLVAFSGPNGCGKTTLLNCIAGSIPESGGFITLCGTPAIDSRDRISFIQDDGGIIPLLTINEQLALQCLLSGLSGDETKRRVDRIIEILDLGRHREKRGRDLSLGLRKRLGIGLGIIREAELFLFDEPFSGLDYPSAQVFCRILEVIKGQEKIAVISSHSIPVDDSLFTRRWVVRDRQVIQNPENDNSPQVHNKAVLEIPWLI